MGDAPSCMVRASQPPGCWDPRPPEPPIRAKLRRLSGPDALGATPTDLPTDLLKNHPNSPDSATRAFYWALCRVHWAELRAADGPCELEGTFAELAAEAGGAAARQWAAAEWEQRAQSFFVIEGCAFHRAGRPDGWRITLLADEFVHLHPVTGC
eukprot:TRINITY_DN30036_c0_g1_i1.p1 TRINITY_DN30036_c0_g1~~TRINITY_DN30036_c0_g1_i1.p1  ORF type:complete len:178 (+),score=64.59 TRINITY_DN30036_c0_g1_i1:73-534(+)